MSFVVCPDGGPNRIIRFVEPGVLPVHTMVAAWDSSTNVLRVDRALFAMLTREQQSHVMKTRESYVEVDTLQGSDLIIA